MKKLDMSTKADTIKTIQSKQNHIVFDNKLTIESLVVFLNVVDFLAIGKSIPKLKGLKGIKIKRINPSP